LSQALRAATALLDMKVLAGCLLGNIAWACSIAGGLGNSPKPVGHIFSHMYCIFYFSDVSGNELYYLRLPDCCAAVIATTFGRYV
jgi:hypothetical protein